MREMAEAFQSLPVGGRAALLMVALFLLWCVFARPFLKAASVFPWLLKKICLVVYMLLDIPVSALHGAFGGVFGDLDQGLAAGTKGTIDFLSHCSRKMSQPKTLYTGRLFLLCLALGFYLLIPLLANLTEKPFTFWQESYAAKEAAVVRWMNDQGWFEKASIQK